MNISEKILAKASGNVTVHPDEIVDANVDVIMVHDLTGPLAIEAFKKIGVSKVWDNKKDSDNSGPSDPRGVRKDGGTA